MASRPQETAAWNRARELFLNLADLSDGEREEAMQRVEQEDPDLRRWVQRLLDQDARDAEAGAAETPEPPARRFGPYEAVGHIAAGGMGEVFRARRVDGEYEREVAIKLLTSRFNEELVLRFHRERQVLARLDHEYIARLLDGGTTEDGQPYLVMELVDGVALDEYCESKQLDCAERMRLIVRVCAAVRHAHGHGVVHRDLKPSNILVRSDGTPRLLDFGIARPALDDDTPGGPLTRTGHMLFTPDYASPEQVNGAEVSEATDIFALGVLMYRLLTGRSPWREDSQLHELAREICERDPIPPSRLRAGTSRRQLAGDLDTIVLKCLEKSPRRRYPRVMDLSDDIERHLSGYPIRARRTSVAARVWRYGRRKPWRVVGLSAIVVIALASATALRSQAQNERRRAELVETIETQVVAAQNLRGQGDLRGSERELRSALATLEAFPDQVFLRARVLGQLAVVANHGRNFELTLEHIADARALLSEDDSHSARLRASLLNSRSYALAKLERDDEAWSNAQEALAYCREALEPGHELTVDALMEIADQLRRRQEYDAAQATLGEAVAEVRSGGDPRDEALGRILNLWGLALADLERFEESLGKFEEALDVLGWHYGEGHRSIAQVRENLGASYYGLERLDEAREQHSRALDTRRRLELEDRVILSLAYLARVEHKARQFDEALVHYAEAIALTERVAGPLAQKLRALQFESATVREDMGDDAGARVAFEAALALPEGAVPLEPIEQGRAHARLGALLARNGERSLAIPHLEAGVETLSAELGEDHPETLAAAAALSE